MKGIKSAAGCWAVRRVGLLTIAALLLAGAAWGAPYSVTDLGTLGGEESLAEVVNSAGQVARHLLRPEQRWSLCLPLRPGNHDQAEPFAHA